MTSKVESVYEAKRRICIIAGDISPIDVITPLPILCEDHDVPYIYVRSKEVSSYRSFVHGVKTARATTLCCQELGAAGLTKRPTSCMLLLPKAVKGGDDDDTEFAEAYDDLAKRIKAVQPTFQ